MYSRMVLHVKLNSGMVYNEGSVFSACVIEVMF